ncbi:4038_t:CDS:2 [Dentiscutata erythropus]|uniref:4038_t:CDS:1 n=1 Tax=Dentiscutata erythropus TaxID=1348616 RepID=A0A9N9ESJ4_9GLOM|nr:4038_t:CDS:2 [Dentiscutata erythropus]
MGTRVLTKANSCLSTDIYENFNDLWRDNQHQTFSANTNKFNEEQEDNCGLKLC